MKGILLVRDMTSHATLCSTSRSRGFLVNDPKWLDKSVTTMWFFIKYLYYVDEVYILVMRGMASAGYDVVKNER